MEFQRRPSRAGRTKHPQPAPRSHAMLRLLVCLLLAAIKRLTVVRNEQDHHVMEPNAKTVSDIWSDSSPIKGENRYYLRIEQTDGNMAWSSPLWISVTK